MPDCGSRPIWRNLTDHWWQLRPGATRPSAF